MTSRPGRPFVSGSYLAVLAQAKTPPEQVEAARQVAQLLCGTESQRRYVAPLGLIPADPVMVGDPLLRALFAQALREGARAPHEVRWPDAVERPLVRDRLGALFRGLAALESTPWESEADHRERVAGLFGSLEAADRAIDERMVEGTVAAWAPWAVEAAAAVLVLALTGGWLSHQRGRRERRQLARESEALHRRLQVRCRADRERATERVLAALRRGERVEVEPEEEGPDLREARP